MSDLEERLIDYYHAGLDTTEREQFDSMVGEMRHLHSRPQADTFAMVYVLDSSISRKAVAAAIGFTHKAIERGWRSVADPATGGT